MKNFFPLRQTPQTAPFKKGDVLVLFGELFTRGYANGLVEAAEKAGMTVIRSTVGRRDKDGLLRPLNADELLQQPQPFINIPLEAGFDLEPDSQGKAPVDYLKESKLSNWQNCEIDFNSVQDSQERGRQRFRENVSAWLVEVEKHVPAGANVIFAHLMAGGVPRAKIVMPVMNWCFKGTGDRYLASEVFWNSSLGRLCQTSFQEVTAATFEHLLELSNDLRGRLEAQGSHVSYVAYGYHGTEVEINQKLQWQTYTPYIQGWAKLELEKISAKYHSQGVNCCVYNCPEILTNSSSIFQGVEIPLYPLLSLMSKDSQPASKELVKNCLSLLKEDSKVEDITEITNGYFNQDVTKEHCDFAQWPQHSSREQMEEMLSRSEKLYEQHKDPKHLITGFLSEAVFSACGYVMLHDSWKPQQPMAWINHDLVVKAHAL